MGTPLDNQLFEILNNGDTEKILEREDLNHKLNYLVEIKMIAKKDVEILLTKDGLEVLELDLYGEKNINFDLFASFIPIKRLHQRPDLSSAIRSADFFPFLMEAAVLSG